MDQPLCTHYTGGACCVNLLTEELGIQVEVVIGPAQILYSMLPSFRTGPVFVRAQFSYGPSFRTKRTLFDYFRRSFKSSSTEELQK